MTAMTIFDRYSTTLKLKVVVWVLNYVENVSKLNCTDYLVMKPYELGGLQNNELEGKVRGVLPDHCRSLSVGDIACEEDRITNTLDDLLLSLGAPTLDYEV